MAEWAVGTVQTKAYHLLATPSNREEFDRTTTVVRALKLSGKEVWTGIYYLTQRIR
jgi:hypothetical protein